MFSAQLGVIVLISADAQPPMEELCADVQSLVDARHTGTVLVMHNRQQIGRVRLNPTYTPHNPHLEIALVESPLGTILATRSPMDVDGENTFTVQTHTNVFALVQIDGVAQSFHQGVALNYDCPRSVELMEVLWQIKRAQWTQVNVEDLPPLMPPITRIAERIFPPPPDAHPPLPPWEESTLQLLQCYGERGSVLMR